MTSSDNPFGYMGKNDLFEADLYIAAMGRSGSTHLASVLTTPPTRWVLNEPRFLDGVLSGAIRERSAEFGWPVDAQHWWIPRNNRSNLSYETRYREFLAPRLRKLARWGVKEVRPDFHLPTIATIQPRKVIVLVRNLRDVALSLLEKQMRQGTMATRGPDWIRDYCNSAAQALLELAERHHDRTRIVRYEDYIHLPSERNDLEKWLDWPMDGEPFAEFTLHNREYEVRRWQDPGGTNEERELPPNAHKIAEEIQASNNEYQQAFGYD